MRVYQANGIGNRKTNGPRVKRLDEQILRCGESRPIAWADSSDLQLLLRNGENGLEVRVSACIPAYPYQITMRDFYSDSGQEGTLAQLHDGLVKRPR